MFTSIYSKWWVQILTLRHFTVQLIKQGSHNSALYKASEEVARHGTSSRKFRRARSPPKPTAPAHLADDH